MKKKNTHTSIDRRVSVFITLKINENTTARTDIMCLVYLPPKSSNRFHAASLSTLIRYHEIKYPVVCTQITDGKYKQNKHVHTFERLSRKIWSTFEEENEREREIERNHETFYKAVILATLTYVIVLIVCCVCPYDIISLVVQHINCTKSVESKTKKKRRAKWRKKVTTHTHKNEDTWRVRFLWLALLLAILAACIRRFLNTERNKSLLSFI